MKKYFALILCLIILLSMYGCGKGHDNSTGSPQTGNLAVRIVWPNNKAMPSNTSRINITITKSDSSVLNDSIWRSSGENSVTKTYEKLPVGTATAQVSAADSAGDTLATGSGTVNIIANATVSSTISLEMVPVTTIARVFVANYDDGTVSVINMETDEVIATINVGGNPIGFALNPAGNERCIAVANPGNNTVFTIRPGTLEITNTVTVPSPSNVKWGLVTVGVEGYVFAAHSTDAKLYKINMNNRTYVTIDISRKAILGRYANSPTLYLFEGAGNSYEKYNLNTDTLSQTAGTEGAGGYVNNDAVRTFFSTGGNGFWQWYNKENDTLGDTIPVGAGTNPQDMTVLVGFFPPQWDLILVTCPGTNQIAWFSSESELTINGTVSVSGSPWNMAYNSAKTKVYITCRDENVVKVLNPSTMTITKSISVGASPQGIIAVEITTD